MPIYQREPGVFRVVVWAKNKPHERSVRGTRAEAEIALMRLRATVGAKYTPASDAERMRNWPTGSGVYVVQIGDDGPIKIGIATNIRTRLQMVQSCNPFAIHLRLVFPNATKDDERRLHDRFHRLHMRGEWFKPGRELVGFIAEMAQESAA